MQLPQACKAPGQHLLTVLTNCIARGVLLLLLLLHFLRYAAILLLVML